MKLSIDLEQYLDWLKSDVMIGVILSVVCFSIQVDMPSGPMAFEISKHVKRSNTSGSVQSKSGSVHILGDLGTEITSACESGDAALLKF